MSNITNNRINTTATTAQITAAKAAFQTVTTNLPFLTSLTTDERKNLTGINVANKAFTEDAIMAAVNNPSLVPSYMPVANIQNDLTLWTQLDEMIFVTQQLLEKLQDTQLLVGSEAYASALSLYKNFTNAANDGLSGADTIVDKLKERFAGQGGAAIPPTSPN